MKNTALIFTMLLLLCSTGCQTQSDDSVAEESEGSLEIQGSDN